MTFAIDKRIIRVNGERGMELVNAEVAHRPIGRDQRITEVETVFAAES